MFVIVLMVLMWLRFFVIRIIVIGVSISIVCGLNIGVWKFGMLNYVVCVMIVKLIGLLRFILLVVIV